MDGRLLHWCFTSSLVYWPCHDLVWDSCSRRPMFAGTCTSMGGCVFPVVVSPPGATRGFLTVPLPGGPCAPSLPNRHKLISGQEPRHTSLEHDSRSQSSGWCLCCPVSSANWLLSSCIIVTFGSCSPDLCCFYSCRVGLAEVLQKRRAGR